MKILIICSKHFYNRIPEIDEKLKALGHQTEMPNSYDEPMKEEEMKSLSSEEHIKWKQEMMLLHEPKIARNDAVLVLNFEKRGVSNYIGGATFLEIFKAFELGKKIFMYNQIPENIFEDELVGINPILMEGILNF